MSKCLLCHGRKGKRKCLFAGGLICSGCCGDTRTKERCGDCSFLAKEGLIRNYGKVPCVPLDEMARSLQWQRRTETIEAAVSRFDRQENRTITDRQVSSILELLLNTYFFNDTTVTCQTEREQKGFTLIGEAIREELADLDRLDIATALGTVYRSVRRRTAGKREYLDFIRQFVYDDKERNFRPLPESFSNNLTR
ncbi:hypothetical protein [Desulfobulbus alkaliphilus]|uniref:hypothetical protein n=1 Tax=Desulfobulbus alkaliphilus TaxID=869814 RepID=UPI0019634C05|nr:hypothetical protein [Desulfobulbus alkaliphilus]MBM9536255.1 hypothetical protein [Desulfobulbus alkaliphilus]